MLCLFILDTCRGVATFSALGGRAMIWGAYDSKQGRRIAKLLSSIMINDMQQ